MQTVRHTQGKSDYPAFSLPARVLWSVKRFVTYGFEAVADRLFPQLVTSEWTRPFPGTERAVLLRARRGCAYNCALVRFRSRLIFVYRYERWPFNYAIHRSVLKQKTFIKGCFLDSDYRQASPISHIEIPGCLAEDPRLIVHNDELLILYNDERQSGNRQMYLGRLIVGDWGIKLDPDRTVRLQPEFPVTKMEKNWVPFVHGGRLFISYTVNPHLVLAVNTANGLCETAYVTKLSTPQMHFYGGGTPALLLDEDRYLAVLHNFDQVRQRYVARAYTFDAAPPFSVRKISSPLPIDYRWVAFPVGLERLDKNTVVLSAGKDEAESLVIEFNVERLETSLDWTLVTSHPVAPKPEDVRGEIESCTLKPTYEIPVDRLKAYEGRYRDSDGMDSEILVQDGCIYWRLKDNRPVRLAAFDDTRFTPAGHYRSPILCFTFDGSRIGGFTTYFWNKEHYFQRLAIEP